MGDITRISLAAAQDQLIDLIRRAMAGETIEIISDGQETVRLTPVLPEAKSSGKRIPGRFPELAAIADEIAKPLPDDEIDLWYK